MAKSTETSETIVTLKERRRSQLSDAHITDYDFVDKDTGCKMKEETVPGPQGTTRTVERNQTHLFQSAPSTTNDAGLLVIEAELAEEGKDLPNPHVPIGMETLEEATDRMKAKDLTPAWEQ